MAPRKLRLRGWSVPLALGSAVVVYAVFFFLLGGGALAVQVGVPVVFAALTAVGVHLMTRPTAAQIDQDAYHRDAATKVNQITTELSRIESHAYRISNLNVQAALVRASATVRELLDRLAETQPTSLYSSASTLHGHVSSLVGLVEQYVDIERQPQYYTDAERLLADGETAVLRFDEFVLDNIRLVNSGDMAEYQANIATVAPPAIPRLDG